MEDDWVVTAPIVVAPNDTVVVPPTVENSYVATYGVASSSLSSYLLLLLLNERTNYPPFIIHTTENGRTMAVR
jgi:hypothetical protein